RTPVLTLYRRLKCTSAGSMQQDHKLAGIRKRRRMEARIDSKRTWVSAHLIVTNHVRRISYGTR
ncbi:hypothetical protein MJD09_09730, partial [bacterium]|nr:hypothetical protein [bacterium]